MHRTRYLLCRTVVLLTLSPLLAATGRAQTPTSAPAEPPDPVCETLFRQYACGGKINADAREAANLLVAYRGRGNGYWRVVLQTLRETDDEQTELSCVRILGKMLAVDGRGREILEEQRRSGKPYGGQWGGPYVVLDDSVVTTLLERATRFKDRRDHRIGNYVEALAAARDPRTRAFLLEVLHKQSEPGRPDAHAYRSDARLEAAMGLAQLGVSAGVEWLIQNCERDDLLSLGPKLRSADERLGAACIRALDDISGDSPGARSTRADWQAWWDRAKADFAARAPEAAEQKDDQ